MFSIQPNFYFWSFFLTKLEEIKWLKDEEVSRVFFFYNIRVSSAKLLKLAAIDHIKVLLVFRIMGEFSWVLNAPHVDCLLLYYFSYTDAVIAW